MNEQMEDDGVTRPAPSSDEKSELRSDRKELAVKFKAQHALLVAFFLLLL